MGRRRKCQRSHAEQHLTGKSALKCLHAESRNKSRSWALLLVLVAEAAPQIHHADHHRAARVKGQFLKTPVRIKPAHGAIKRMGDDADGADDVGRGERALQRKQHERAGVALALKGFINRKLTQEQDR